MKQLNLENIKICFFTREYAHPALGKTGGIGVFVKQFAKQLKRKGFQVTVLTYGKEKGNFSDDGIEVIILKDSSAVSERLRQPFQKYKIPGYITLKKGLEEINHRVISRKVSRFLKKNVVDIVEFHDYGGDAPYVKTKVPIVIRCHGTAQTLYQFMGYALRGQDAVYEKKMFKRINKNVVAVSQFSANTTKKAFGLKKSPKVIYNGVVLPVIDKSKEYLSEPTRPYSMWYFGSVRERKGIDIACKVFNQIIEKYPEASFHVMGNNNNDHWNKGCVNILSEKAFEKTTYYGTIPNKQVNDYLKKAHIVLFPSYGENFSIALLEVMALGKVAITSSIPAFQEIIISGENGYMANTLEEYIEMIDKAFQNSENLEKIAKQARKTIEENFEMDKILNQNIQYYKKVIKDGK